MGDLVNEPSPEHVPEPGEQPDLEQLLKISQGIAGPVDQAIGTMSAVHAQWYQAWIENGIPEHQAGAMLRVMIAVNCGATLVLGS